MMSSANAPFMLTHWPTRSTWQVNTDWRNTKLGNVGQSRMPRWQQLLEGLDALCRKRGICALKTSTQLQRALAHEYSSTAQAISAPPQCHSG
jgi:hypothetical protein